MNPEVRSKASKKVTIVGAIIDFLLAVIKVFAGFVVALGIFGIAPFLFIVLLFILETLIAFLQAYVFAVLTCLYLSDSFHPEH